jgi:hypothetical protein
MLQPAPARRQKRTATMDRWLKVDELTLWERRTLGPALYDIFCRSYADLDYDTVCDEIIFRPGGDLILFTDSDGELAGFVGFKLEFYTVHGRRFGVFSPGGYFRRDIRGGGNHMARASFRRALWANLRHPLTPMLALIEALTPASYRRAALTWWRYWPHRSRETPAALGALLGAVIDDRPELVRSGDHPLVVRYDDPAVVEDEAALERSTALQGDPDAAFYRSLNPDFARGDVLCTLCRVGLSDLLIGALRVARGR